MIRIYRLNIQKNIIFESRKELKNCSQIAVSLKNYEQSTNDSSLPDNAALSNDLKELWTNVHKNMRKLSGEG